MISNQEAQNAGQLVSNARLSSYKQHLGTTSVTETIGAYMWNSSLSAAFSPLIQAIEVGLRNTLNNTLSPIYGSNWFEHWITQEASHLRGTGKLGTHQDSESERQIKKAQLRIKKRDTAERKRNGQGNLPKNYSPNCQRVLAELTFGFWVRFLMRWYWDVNTGTKIWPQHLLGAFPGAPKHKYSVGTLHNEFSVAVDLRNRIHHHEPLWKGPNVANVDDAIQTLTQKLNKMLALLEYLGSDKKAIITKYGVISAIEELCTKECFLRFIGRQSGHQLSLKLAKKDLRLVAKNASDAQSVWVTNASNSPILVIRNANRRFF